MLTPLRLMFLLGIAAVGPYLASETDLGRTAFTKFTNLFRASGQQRSTGSSETYASTAWPGGSTSGTSGQSYSSAGGQSYSGTSGDPRSGLARDPRDATYANHSHYEVEKLRRQDFRYDEQLARKLGGIREDQSPSLVGATIPDLREVVRFDISPDWVINRFSRVSTVLADMSLQGLRVPIVTGTKADDLAGTLTYYFDKSGSMQRLTVHGFTGSPQKLVGTMTEHFGLSQEPTLEAGVYTKRWNSQPVHFLRLTHAPVVYSDAIHQKYTLFLELNHPNLAYGISNEARRIVTADHSTGRW